MAKKEEPAQYIMFAIKEGETWPNSYSKRLAEPDAAGDAAEDLPTCLKIRGLKVSDRCFVRLANFLFLDAKCLRRLFQKKM